MMALLHSSTSVFYGFSLLGSMLLQRCWCWGEGGGGCWEWETLFRGNPALGWMDGSHCLGEWWQWLQRLLTFAFSLPFLFSSLVCGKRYKNRPGLSYHYAHTHLASEEGDEAQDQETRSPPNHRNENHRREFPVVGLGEWWGGWAGLWSIPFCSPRASSGGTCWLVSRTCGELAISAQPQMLLWVSWALSLEWAGQVWHTQLCSQRMGGKC